MAQANFAQEIEKAVKAAGDEPIEAVYICDDGIEPYESDEYIDTPLPWTTARPKLDYEYNNGYGTQSCHNVYVWTAGKVFYVQEYDGSTSIAWIPRHPPSNGEEIDAE